MIWRRPGWATPSPRRRLFLTTLALSVSSPRQRLVLTLTPGVDFDLDLVNARVRDGTCTMLNIYLEKHIVLNNCLNSKAYCSDSVFNFIINMILLLFLFKNKEKRTDNFFFFEKNIDWKLISQKKIKKQLYRTL